MYVHLSVKNNSLGDVHVNKLVKLSGDKFYCPKWWSKNQEFLVLNEWIMHTTIETARYERNNVGGKQECALTAKLLNEFIMPGSKGGSLHQMTVISDISVL